MNILNVGYDLTNHCFLATHFQPCSLISGVSQIEDERLENKGADVRPPPLFSVPFRELR